MGAPIGKCFFWRGGASELMSLGENFGSNVEKSQKKLKKLSKNAKSRVKKSPKMGGGGVQNDKKKGTIYNGKIFGVKTMIKYW